MTEKNVEIEIQVLLPEIENTSDDCIVCLLDSIRDRKGILHVHLIREDGTVSLCVHYDPNLISLKSVRKLAQRIGSSLTNRYRHERIPFEGMDNADEASILRRKLESLTGMLHASVNYAAGLAFVAYDTNALRPEIVANTMKGMGIKPLDWPQTAEQELDTHDHGSAPDFLPHWVQERWTLILVGLAGLFLLIGWAGEKFFELPSEIALIFFLLSILSEGYDIATHAVPGLLRGNFDTDVLMMAAAAGAAILGEWAEGAFLLFLFSLGHAGEHYALDRARNAVNALGKLMPKTALLKKMDRLLNVLWGP